MIKKLKQYIDFKLIAILSLVYLIFVIIYASKNAYLRILRNRSNGKSEWGAFIFYNLLDWFLIIVFMIFIAFTTKYLIRKKTKLIYIFSIHLFFSFFIGAFTLSISSIIENLNASGTARSFKSLFASYISLIDLHFLIYLSLVTIIYMYYYFQKNQENTIKTSKLQEQLTKARLKFLQSQMHPHFLFNTLNGIHSLIDIDPNKSKSIIVDLSDILRNVLEKKDQNLIELQDELSILRKYISIKKIRFSDQLNFQINIEDGMDNILVPNMLIQPLVENAIKHGYDKEHLFLEVIINIYQRKDILIIKIENNGKKINEELPLLLKKGTGLNNIKERLSTLYQNNCELKIFNEENRVITRIKLPIQLSISEIIKNY